MWRLQIRIVAALWAVFVFTSPALAQINSLTREEMIKYTAQNPFDRFPDGRPKVPDALLKEFNNMSSEEVMGAGRGAGPAGARVTFVSGFQVLNPGRKLIGRAVTLQLMPTRPDVAGPDAEDWKKKGNATPLNHQSALDVLQAGDVIVIDAGGNINAGGIIGDNLAYYIWKKTGAGFVIDGAIRDLEGIASFGMAGYFRAAVPPAIQGLMVTGINVPVRIGNATVMPGDVVFGDREGVNFIPPQSVQALVDNAIITHIHDEWTRMKFDQNKYKSTDIYSSPKDPALIQEYEEFLKQKLGPAKYEEYRKRKEGKQ
ncbi:MAG: dimethylmenaquinone methyltransferase [Acidobacteriia bacterium]|nr:dimethylmenaquinone methyltransferase [Terriglobia bacterium]